MRGETEARCLITALAMGVAWSAAAESVVWEENFDGAVLPAGWAVEGEGWEVGWLPPSEKGPGGAIQGPLAATHLSGLYPPNADVSLVRELPFVIPEAERDPVLQFFNWRELANDTCVVEIRPDGGNWESLREFTTSQSFWWVESLPLSAYAGQSVQIRFRLTSDASDEGAGWYLDGLSVVADEIAPSPPTILVQPTDDEVVPGQNADFSVQVAGSGPFLYQWRRNGEKIPGANGPTYSITDVAPTDSGAYSVVVENAYGVAYSAVASLTVTVDPLPFADDFASRGTISEELKFGRGTNRSATLEPGEPDHASKRGGTSVWLEWVASASGVATFATTGSDFDTLLAVYAGDSLDGLIPVASDDDGGGFYTSRMVFNAEAGESYQIVVDGRGGVEGEIVLGWDLEVTAEAVPRLLAQPQGVVYVDTPVVLAVVAQAQEALAYQWYRNDIPLAGATSARLQLSEVLTGDVGTYSVSISTSTRTVMSEGVPIEIGSTPGQPMRDKLADVVDARELGRRVRTRGSVPPAFVAPRLGHLDFRTIDTSLSRTDLGETNLVVGGSSKNIEVRLDESAHLMVYTSETVLDTVLGLYALPEGARNFFQIFAQGAIAENDDDGPDQLSRIVAELQPGSYLLRVDDSLGVGGLLTLNWLAGHAPAILQQPKGGLFSLTEPIELSVEATGEPQVEYRWKRDGVSLEGQHGHVLRINHALPEHQGNYGVEVVNDFGSVQSEVAEVRVSSDQSMFLLHPESQRLNPGEDLVLRVQVGAEPNLTLQWWRDDEAIPGATNATLSLLWLDLLPWIERQGIPGAAQVGGFRVVATNVLQHQTSEIADVTVAGFFMSPPDLTIANQAKLTIPASPGTRVRIEVSTNLMDWSRAYEGPVQQQTGWPDLASPGMPHRFYRLTLDPPP